MQAGRTAVAPLPRFLGNNGGLARGARSLPEGRSLAPRERSAGADEPRRGEIQAQARSDGGAGNGVRTRDIQLGKATKGNFDQATPSNGERDRATKTGYFSLPFFFPCRHRAPPKAPVLHHDQEQNKNRRIAGTLPV